MKKRLFAVGSLLAVLTSLALLAQVFTAAAPAPADLRPDRPAVAYISLRADPPLVTLLLPPDPGPGAVTLKPDPRPEDVPLPAGPSRPAPQAERPGAFARLPLDQPRRFDFAMGEGLRGRLTPREQADQLLDWTLFAVVGDAGLSADELNRALFDVPTLRHGYLRPVASFEYGPTRTCRLDGERVLVLLPKCGEAQRKDYLAHAADEHRKSLGARPGRLLVFEYELQPERLRGVVTRRADVDGAELFTAAYGYREAEVRGRDDLKGFLDEVRDVTYAHLDGGRLTLGGRCLLAREYRGFRVEDVAAVWQAQDKLNRQREATLARYKGEADEAERRWKAEREEVRGRWQARLDELNASRRRGLPDTRPGRYGLGRLPGSYEPPPDVDDLLRRYEAGRDPWGLKAPAATDEADYTAKAAALQAGYDREIDVVVKRQKREADALLKRQEADWLKTPLVDHTGFSLDPEYDFDGLRKWFKDEAEEILKETAKGKNAPIAAADIEAAGAALGKDNVVPLLVLLDKLRRSDDVVAALTGQLLEAGQERLRFQKARYDGDLQGTEVGMVLFYTDLLAKLWTLDYQDTLPRREVEDFRADLDGGNPPLYRAETVKYPGTRIWFGPEDRAFQLVQDRRGVLFARRATRIFSASSNPLAPGQEVPTNHAAAKVMDWWNDHYEEVARYEPEYERLNEYIKWSVLISWLDSRKSLDRLAFLGDVTVDRSAWFKDWAARHKELRYQKWDKVGFFDRGYKGTTTEAMPILMSKSFRDYGDAAEGWHVSGGVSGARPKDLDLKPVLTPELTARARTPLGGVDLKTLDPSGKTLTTTRGAKLTFEEQSPAQASLTATPARGQALRATHGDLAPTAFERTVTRAEGELRLNTRAGAAELGELSITPTANGFAVGFESRDVDAGQALGRDLSVSKDPRAFLAGDARVEALYELGDGAFLVKLRGGKKLLKLAPEPEPSPTVGAGWQGRVADVKAGAVTYDLAWVEPADAPRAIGDAEYLRLDLRPLVDRRPGIVVLARGPPSGELPDGLRAVEIGGPEKVVGLIDARGETLFVRRADLPKALAEAPERLTRLVGSADRSALKATGGDEPLVARLEAGDTRGAGRLMAEDPAAARRQLDADLARRRVDADRYLEQGRPGEAKELLEKGLRLHPDHPDLLARLGLAEAELGRPDAAAEDLTRTAERARDPQPLLDEVNRRLRGQPAGPAREHALRQARLAAARDLVARKKSAAEVQAVAGKEGAEIEARLPDEPKVEAARPGDLGDGAALYLDDAAGLENRDWSPGAREKTLEQAVEGGELELLRLHEADPVFQTSPDVVRLGKTRTAPRFRLAPRERYGSPAVARVYYLPKKDDYCEEGADEGKDDKPEIDCKDRSVYLLRRKVKP
jgi:hypothetical protein